MVQLGNLAKPRTDRAELAGVNDPTSAPAMRRAASNAEPPAMLTALVAQSRDSAGVSRRRRRASELLPQLVSSAVPEAEAPLLADPRAGLSVEHMCHPEIRVRHDAPAARPMRRFTPCRCCGGGLSVCDGCTIRGQHPRASLRHRFNKPVSPEIFIRRRASAQYRSNKLPSTTSADMSASPTVD